jgi:hypothetical protein
VGLLFLLFSPLQVSFVFPKQAQRPNEEAIEMAKKPSAKAASKAKRATKVKAAAPKKSPIVAKRSAASPQKYEQAGAPWWKQHLPN